MELTSSVEDLIMDKEEDKAKYLGPCYWKKREVGEFLCLVKEH